MNTTGPQNEHRDESLALLLLSVTH